MARGTDSFDEDMEGRIKIDTIAAINSYLFTYLREDTILTDDLLGNNNIRVGLANRSDVYPYVVFDINPDVNFDTPIVVNSDLQVDIWNKPDNHLTTQIYGIRNRLIKLLDQHAFALDEGEAKGLRIYLNSMGFVGRDPDVEFVQHIIMLFSLRYIRSEDLVY